LTDSFFVGYGGISVVGGKLRHSAPRQKCENEYGCEEKIDNKEWVSE